MQRLDMSATKDTVSEKKSKDMKKNRFGYSQIYLTSGAIDRSLLITNGMSPVGRMLTVEQQRAKYIISLAAEEDSALTLCLRLGKQREWSDRLTTTCDEALKTISAGPGTEDDALYWTAVNNVTRDLQSAVKAAAVVAENFFWKRLCDVDEIDKRVELSTKSMLALYDAAPDLFWEIVIFDVQDIRSACEKSSEELSTSD